MTKASNKKGSEREPFTTIDIRAVIDATPEEHAVILAVQLLHWWLGPDQAKGLELIEAVLINPDRPKRIPAGNTKEELGQISPKGIKRALARLRQRGWIETSRKFKEKISYQLTIPTLAFNDAYSIILNRMTPSLRASLAQRAQQPSGQLGLSFGPAQPDQGASSAPDIILSNQTTDTQTKQKDLPPGKPALKHPDEKVFWDLATKSWLEKHSGEKELAWPVAKGFQAQLTKELTRLGAIKLAERWNNCVNDEYSRASLKTFIYDTDRYVLARSTKKGGARAFHSPESDWQPREAAK